MAKLLDAMKAAEEIVKDNFEVGHSNITRYSCFVPEEETNICLEPAKTKEDEQRLSRVDVDERAYFNLYYIEDAPKDRDMTGFIEKKEAIKKELRKSGDLKSTVLSFTINSEFKDRGKGDNIEFVVKLQINAQLK